MPITRPGLQLNLALAINARPAAPSTPNTSYLPWLRSAYIRLDNHDLLQLGRLESALRMIDSTLIGRELLETISVIATQKKHALEIIFNSDQMGVFAHDVKNASNGVGTGSVLQCNFFHAASANTDERISPEMYDAVVTFHELVHVYHNLIGEQVFVTASDKENEIYPALLHEEARTVGLGPFSNESLSENHFREQIGCPRREKYAHVDAVVNDDGTVYVGLTKRPLIPFPGRVP